MSVRARSFLLALLLGAGLAGCGSSSPHPTTASTTVRSRTAAHRVHHAPVSTEVRNATPQPGWRPYTGPVPIILYHELGIAPPTEPYPGLYMPYPIFAQEMAWLHSAGYQAVTLDEVLNAWYHHGTLPAKPIVITFDNGYPPQVTFAPKILSKYGWPAVLNEITDNHLYNYQIAHVLKLGWEVDSHSVTHPDLATATPAELKYQLVASRQFLQRTFHIPVNGFAYPSSDFNATVIAAVKAAGYKDATTEGFAYATRNEPYLLPRFEQETGLAQLQADLATPH